MSVPSSLIPGSNVIQDVIQKMSDQIVTIVDQILTEKADAMMYEIIQPKIEENLKTIFQSHPVQLEASKMFNREIFPIYKSTLEDFSNFNEIINGTKGDINKAIDEYTQEIKKDPKVIPPNAKPDLIKKLKTISESKVGAMKGGNGTMKGGDGTIADTDLKEFLENDENKFKQIEGGSPPHTYLTKSENSKISDAIKEIVSGMKTSYDEKKENIQKSEEDFSTFNKKRRENMRIPGITSCPSIDDMKKTEENVKDIENAQLQNEIKELKKVPKIGAMTGGKHSSKRRKLVKRKSIKKSRKN